jgi:archaellum biogenesis ATPase FlaH
MKLAFTMDADNIVDVKSLIPGIDRACDGFRDGELIVISGPTKNGKTLLAQSLTVNFCKQNNFPLWFTFEVPARQFLGQFPELPLIYMPQKLKPRAMDWFEDRVYESFEKFHTRIIFIDHLHYLVDLARQKQMSIEIGTIIRQLKTLAVNGNFVIFLLCHTTKGKQDGTLSYESIRDSSFISQESDAVIMIKRTPDDGENTARARVEFHRRTGILERTIQLIKINGVLRENATGQYN